MKSKVQCWKRIDCRPLNSRVPIALVMFILSVFCVESAYATNTVIRFHGVLTQASCEVHQSSPGERVGRVVQMSTGVTLIVDTQGNVCSGPAAVISLGYRALSSSVATVGSGRRGVVIVTYE